MLHALRVTLMLLLVIVCFWAVAMMFYTLGKSMGAATVEDNRRWKKRYYKWVLTFLCVWVSGLLLFKFGK